MNVQILVSAKVVEYEGEKFKDVEQEIMKNIRESMRQFAGSKHKATSYDENGVYDVLEDVDHEVAFEYEGTFEFISAEESEQRQTKDTRLWETLFGMEKGE